MALRRVPDTVHTLHDSVHCSVVAYGIVGSIKVVVDSSRQSYTAHIVLLREDHSTRKRAVSTHHHERVDAFLLHILVCLGTSFFGAELCRARCLQYRTASANYSADVFGRERLYLALHKSVISSVDSLDIETVIDAGTGDGTYCCVHSGCITTRGQDAYSLDFCHSSIV